jgi:hypothetical protein
MGAAALIALGFKLPLRQDAIDPCTVADAEGHDIFTVDANGERPDEQAEAIAKALIELINVECAAEKAA